MRDRWRSSPVRATPLGGLQPTMKTPMNNATNNAKRFIIEKPFKQDEQQFIQTILLSALCEEYYPYYEGVSTKIKYEYHKIHKTTVWRSEQLFLGLLLRSFRLHFSLVENR